MISPTITDARLISDITSVLARAEGQLRGVHDLFGITDALDMAREAKAVRQRIYDAAFTPIARGVPRPDLGPEHG